LSCALAAGGCYQSFDGTDECAAEPLCFADARPLCLDELAVGIDDDACQTIEVTGTADDCTGDVAFVHVVTAATGAHRLWMEATITDVPPGAHAAGIMTPDGECRPCSSGISTDEPRVGWFTASDAGFGYDGSVPDREYVFIGRGVRYRVTFCSLPAVPPGS
jgi:hypothetical protein